MYVKDCFYTSEPQLTFYNGKQILFFFLSHLIIMVIKSILMNIYVKCYWNLKKALKNINALSTGHKISQYMVL